LCSHAGTATPTAPNTRVTVSGQPVTTITAPYIIAGCPFTVPAGPVPCVTGQWLNGSTRVFADGQPLVLTSSASICAPNGTPMTVVATQVRVQAA
jgi:hypothetical protein